MAAAGTPMLPGKKIVALDVNAQTIFSRLSQQRLITKISSSLKQAKVFFTNIKSLFKVQMSEVTV